MKHTLRTWVLKTLQFLAKRRLKALHPGIVGITGSTGKTTSKELIASVLDRRFKVMKSEGNLNTEFGIALSILGEKSGYQSAFKWFGILYRAVRKAFGPIEPCDLFVVEMGVDEPGDMDKLLALIQPDVMVFLNVKTVHIGEGQFANKEAVFREKSKATLAVKPGGWVVLNVDDPYVRQLRDKLPARIITVGTEPGADLVATDITMSPKGLEFTLRFEDQSIPVQLPNVLGEHHVSLVLAAIAVGFIHELPWKTIELALRDFQLPPGRMNPIEGKNGSTIIDSSYNASPDTMEAGLNVMSMFDGRKIAALGTMNELGDLTESAHLKIGKLAAQTADVLIAVGEHAKWYAEGAKQGGMLSSSIHTFYNAHDAGEFLSQILQKNDVVLAKGSQDRVRMERLVKACMKSPDMASLKLVRQDPYWLTHS